MTLHGPKGKEMKTSILSIEKEVKETFSLNDS